MNQKTALLELETELIIKREEVRAEVMKHLGENNKDYWMNWGSFLQVCDTLFDVRERLKYQFNCKVDFSK